jgi:hypothetical protein
VAWDLAPGVRTAGLALGLTAIMGSPALASVGLSGQARTADQGKPVSAVAADRTIRRFDIQWDADCTSGATWSDRTIASNVANDPAGNPVDQGSYPERPGSGGAADVEWTLQATSNGQDVSGTFAAMITLKDASGNPVDNCATGPIGFDLHLRSNCGDAAEGRGTRALISATGVSCRVARRLEARWSGRLNSRLLRRLIPKRALRFGPTYRLTGYACHVRSMGLPTGEHVVQCTVGRRRSIDWLSFIPEPPVVD